MPGPAGGGLVGLLSQAYNSLPPFDGRFAAVLILSYSLLAVVVLVVLLCFKSGRKQLRKFWRLSKEGPFYKLGAYLWRKSFAAFVAVSRPVFGKRLVTDPTRLVPRFTVIKTQSDRIILQWQYAGPISLTACWSDDQYELQVCAVSPTAGAGKEKVSQWETLQLGPSCSFDYTGLEPGRGFAFRVRTLNSRGTSEWTACDFSTRQVPVEHGGRGPGYSWKQSSQDVQLWAICRANAKSKDIAVECTSTRVRIEDRGTVDAGAQLVLAGDFTERVKASEMSWTLTEDAGGDRCVVLTVEKLHRTSTRKEHWQCLLKGHPLIDRRFLPEGVIEGKLEP